MRKALLFDLDDTLIDTRIRHYKVVTDFFCLNSLSVMPYEQYSHQRTHFKKTNLDIVCEIAPELKNGFKEFWMKNIEATTYLRFDREIVQKYLLQRLKLREIALILLSLRSNLETARLQFEKFTFSTLFDESFFLPHGSENPKTGKVTELKKQFDILGMVGDAVSDMEAAENNHIPFIGIKTGWYPLSANTSFDTINDYLKLKSYER